MTAAMGGGELATEWVTLLPETATLAKRLREFRPAPIRVPVEVDTDQMERESRSAGRSSGRHIDTEIKRETRGTGRGVSSNVAGGLNDGTVSRAARRLGRSIKDDIEGETRKISFKHIGTGILGIGSAVRETASGTMTIVRNIGSIAMVIRYASKAAKGLSLSMLAAATATRVVTGAGIARLGVALGFASKQADRLATQVARVTSALLVAAAVGKFLGFMNKASKIMGLLTVGSVALVSAAAGLTQMLAGPLYSALLLAGSGLGIAAGAAAGLLGPMLLVAKIGFKGMSEGIKSVQKDWKDLDEAFYKTIGERMRPMLESWHNLSNGITDSMTTAMIPTFGNLGTLMDRLAPKSKMLAGTFGDLSNEVTRGLLGPQATQALDTMFDASNRFFRSFLGESGITGATTGLLKFTATAADTFSGVGGKLNELLLKFGEWVGAITPAQMKAVFAVIEAQLTNIWNLAKPIYRVFKDLGQTGAAALGPAFKAIGDNIAKAAPGISNMAKIIMPALSQVIQNLAPSIPALVQAFTPMASIMAVILPPLASLVTQLAPMAPLILAVTTAVKAATIALALYNTGMLLVTNATKIARAAQWAWNAALAANPIGLVVAAIAAVVGALALFFTKTETGRKMWDKIWTGIKTTFTTVWNFIKTEGGKLWEQLKPSLQSLWQTVTETFGKIKNAFTELWPKIQPVVAVIAKAWMAFEKFKWQAIIVGIKAIAAVIGWWVQNVVVPGFKMAVSAVQTWWAATQAVFNVVKTVVMFLWQNVFKPAFDFIAAGWKILWFAIQVGWEAGKIVFDAIKDAVLFVWHNVFEPAFRAIGAVVEAAWAVMQVVFDGIKVAITAVGDAATWLWHTIFEPVWEGIKAGWDTLWNYLKPIFDVFKAGIQGIGDIATKIADGIKSAWSGLEGVFKAPLHALGTFLAGVPDKILGVEIPFVSDIHRWGQNLQGLAGGGIIKGPGTGTSDSILGLDKSGIPTARVSAGEGVVPERALATPIGKLLFAALLDVPALKGGGQVEPGQGDAGLNPGAAWLRRYIMDNFGVKDIGGRRSEDGYGEHSSGNAMDIMVGSDKSLGDKIAGFLKTNKDVLGLDGMIWQQRSYGYGGGWDGKMMSDRGSPTQNHMDHIHAILGKGRGANAASVGLPTGQIINPTGVSSSPGSITGSTYSTYTGGSISGGDGATAGHYEVNEKQVREATDRVTDLTNSLDIKQKKLDEYLAKQAKGEKVNATTIEAARDAIDKNQRDLDQAKSDLEAAKQGKFVQGSKPGKGSKDSAGAGGQESWGDVGKMIFSGFLESFGFDGSVLTNLFDTPNVKSAMAGLNWGLGMLFPGDKEGENASSGAPQQLGLGGPGLNAGMDVLAGIGDQAGVSFPHGQAPDGTTPGPGNQPPVFDLRGSQLGVSPAAFEDKMGEMTAANRRHPTLGPT